jgi:hypothetical protein
MSFSHAKAKALWDASLIRGELASPGTLSPVELGGSGGEVVGGSGGGAMDFLTPGRGAASTVDSVEEMFLDDKRWFDAGFKSQKDGAVQLIFPLCSGEVGLDKQWPWNLCKGLIGGPRGNRFCTKTLGEGNSVHCGIVSHATNKADLEEGHGYIPKLNDRSNTELAFLEPYVSSAQFPDSINDLAEQALLHEEWVRSSHFFPPRR